MAELIYSVTELNTYLQRMLREETLMRAIHLRGEISGYKSYPSGQTFFSLKDEESIIRCIYFGTPEAWMRDGMQVVAKGALDLYVPTGQYQLKVEKIQADGVGAWYSYYERVRMALEKEGLFDQKNKKPLPSHPRRIGIITSVMGAAVHDIIRVTGQRSPATPLVIYPVAVQGDDAVASLVEAVTWFNEHPVVDVLIIGRGGGPVEELWAFNDERVVRAVAGSILPVVSAVGHETDVALTDFAADARAATPSMAAEMVTENRITLLQHVDELSRQLDENCRYRLYQAKNKLDQTVARLEQNAPQIRILREHRRYAVQRQRMEQLIQGYLDRASHALELASARLEAVDPKKIMERGYVLVYDERGLITRRPSGQQQVTLCWQDGTRRAQLLEEQHESV